MSDRTRTTGCLGQAGKRPVLVWRFDNKPWHPLCSTNSKFILTCPFDAYAALLAIPQFAASPLAEIRYRDAVVVSIYLPWWSATLREMS